MRAKLRHEIHQVAPDLSTANIRMFDEIVTESMGSAPFTTFIVSAFPSVGLSLAAVGVFSVFAFSVAARTRKIRHPARAGRDSPRRNAVVPSRSPCANFDRCPRRYRNRARAGADDTRLFYSASRPPIRSVSALPWGWLSSSRLPPAISQCIMHSALILL